MAIELITGHAGSDHVSSADAGAFHAGAVGSGQYVLKTANEMAATMQDANTISIATGDALFDGRHVRITSAETATIDSGTQGQYRNDIVGIWYAIAGGVESASLKVYKGTPTSGEPSDPTLPATSILDGDTTAFMPLYRVSLDGISPDSPEQLFNKIDSLAAYETSNDSAVSGINGSITTLTSGLAAINAKHKGGALVQTSTNVNYSNNDTWLVTLSTSTKTLITLVWVLANTGHVQVIYGTPVSTEGSRWGVVPGGSVFGIYSQTEASVWSATKLN